MLVFNKVEMIPGDLEQIFVDRANGEINIFCSSDSDCVVSFHAIDEYSPPFSNQKLLNGSQVFGLGHVSTISFVVRIERVPKISSATDKDSEFISLTLISDTVADVSRSPLCDEGFLSLIRFCFGREAACCASVGDNVTINEGDTLTPAGH
jgi:hypothetical protein